jgi:hypothetical protein
LDGTGGLIIKQKSRKTANSADMLNLAARPFPAPWRIFKSGFSIHRPPDRRIVTDIGLAGNRFVSIIKSFGIRLGSF